MQKRSMELLVEAGKKMSERLGHTIEVIAHESIRHGQQTCGVVVAHNGHLVAAAAIAGKLAKDANEQDQLIEDLLNMRTDGMGYDLLAY